MKESDYTARQLQIIRGEVPLDSVRGRELTVIIKNATALNDKDVLKIAEPMKSSLKAKQTKSAYDYINEYSQKNYAKISGLFPLDYKDKVQEIASERGMSVSRFVVEAVCEKAGLPLPN